MTWKEHERRGMIFALRHWRNKPKNEESAVKTEQTADASPSASAAAAPPVVTPATALPTSQEPDNYDTMDDTELRDQYQKVTRLALALITHLLTPSLSARRVRV
jgi:hypothetical protein